MWSVLIAIGAILVAVGNINYNSTRDRERALAAGAKAMSMIKTECTNNLKQVAAMRQAIANGQMTIDEFQTAAWSIVSSGSLLVQVDQETIGSVAEIYYLIGLANKEQAQMLELTFGIAGSLSNAPQLLQQHIGYLKSDLDRLEPKLAALGSKIK
jgi:hypothetical protein